MPMLTNSCLRISVGFRSVKRYRAMNTIAVIVDIIRTRFGFSMNSCGTITKSTKSVMVNWFGELTKVRHIPVA